MKKLGVLNHESPVMIGGKGEVAMMLWVTLGGAAVICAAAFARARRKAREVREYEQYSVEPAMLKELQERADVRLYDVRQPLDLLAHLEIIPGAVRIPPKEVLANPDLLPREQDVVLYCTCEGQKTSLEILRHAQSLGFHRIKVLRGGVAAWKANGYPVEKYVESFRLDTVG